MNLSSISLITEIFIVGLVLSVDSFSVAVAMGLRPFQKKDALRFAFSSGGAEALFALLGAMAGVHLITQFKAFDHWIAFFLLAAVSLHMAYEGLKNFKGPREKEETVKFHSYAKLLILSFATSLDAFCVGIGLGVSQKPILPFVLSIGIWAFAVTIIGMYLARKISGKLGPVINLFGAVVIMILAFQMLKI